MLGMDTARIKKLDAAYDLSGLTGILTAFLMAVVSCAPLLQNINIGQLAIVYGIYAFAKIILSACSVHIRGGPLTGTNNTRSGAGLLTEANTIAACR